MVTSSLSWVGLPKLLAKLDANLNIGAESAKLLGSVGGQGQSYLLGLMPGDWKRPRNVSLRTSEKYAALSMPRYPYLFFERGSSKSGAGGRPHRRKTERQFKNSAYRIRPRRYLRRTKGFMSKQLKAQLLEMKTAVEREWKA